MEVYLHQQMQKSKLAEDLLGASLTTPRPLIAGATANSGMQWRIWASPAHLVHLFSLLYAGQESFIHIERGN